jgi:CRP/FNR family transcriptional regulator, cyclic AMP receptor protein
MATTSPTASIRVTICPCWDVRKAQGRGAELVASPASKTGGKARRRGGGTTARREAGTAALDGRRFAPTQHGTGQRGSNMIDRFVGATGRPALLAALAEQKIVGNQAEIAEAFANVGQVIEVQSGEAFIQQGDTATDVFFIITGGAKVVVHGKTVAERRSGQIVGEMSAIDRTRPRAATLVASETSVLLKVGGDAFRSIADNHQGLWRSLAELVSRRLEERNHLIAQRRQRVTVFIVSSTESIPITDLIVRHFAHDEFLTVRWQHGVFKASHYPLEDLEHQLDVADFAIAVVSADDKVRTRGKEWPAVRDNVILELGMFMGRLGRHRAFLMEPRKAGVKLPSDTAGLTTIPFRHEKGLPDVEAMATIAPACAELRAQILALGPRE